MRSRTLGYLVGLVLAVMLPSASARSNSDPVANASSVSALLAKAENAQVSDYLQLPMILEQLHQHDELLSLKQRWHLKLLDAQRLSFDGNFRKAVPMLRDIVDHSGDRVLSVRAMARLIRENFVEHHYVEAYALANTLMAELPHVTDPTAQLEGMDRIISMLNSSTIGQYDLALQYAKQMKATLTSAGAQCVADMAQTNALLYAGKLGSADPRFKQSVNLCLAAKRPLRADALLLNQASAMIDENQAGHAIDLLHRITPEIKKSGYPPHLASLQVTLAQAYLSLGDAKKAQKFALVTTTMSGANRTPWILQAAYKVLYQAEKLDGDDAAALKYYEKYITLKSAAMDDAKARALAYQMVKQQVEAKKLKLDALGKQNKILQLRQALAGQAQKTSRMYNLLLLAVIAFIVLAMFWLRRSQLRFRRMARRDGLTGVFNREHYFDEAERALRRLHKANVDACLVMLDLDHFKKVNDTYGHAAGDEVLRRAVSVCRRELRESDVFGRLGGEEFGILMPACSREQGIAIATRIRQTLAATSMVLDPGTTIMVSASFGLACSAISGHTVSALYADADAALYRAKEGGRNQLAVGTGGDGPATFRADAEVAGCA